VKKVIKAEIGSSLTQYAQWVLTLECGHIVRVKITQNNQSYPKRKQCTCERDSSGSAEEEKGKQ
jgi:hypothetical protein